jgi:hypothetical protein
MRGVGRPSPVSFPLVTDTPEGQPPVPEPTPRQEPTPVPGADPNADPTPPRRPRPTGPIQYKGDDLEAARGPGLGCFRFQVVVLAILIILTPLSVAWNWPPAVSAGLLFTVILLLLITGQTIIFLLRLVAADRRGRRRPLASGTRTVGELEDAAGSAAADSAAAGSDPAGPGARAADDAGTTGQDEISARLPSGDS